MQSLETELLGEARPVFTILASGVEGSAEQSVSLCDLLQRKLRVTTIDSTAHDRVAAEVYRTRGLALVQLGVWHEAVADLTTAARYMDDNFVRTDPTLLREVTLFALAYARMCASLPEEPPLVLDGHEILAIQRLLDELLTLEETFEVLIFGNLAPIWRVRTRLMVQWLKAMRGNYDRHYCAKTLELLNACEAQDTQLRTVCEWQAGHHAREGEVPNYDWRQAIMDSLKVFAEHRQRYAS